MGAFFQMGRRASQMGFTVAGYLRHQEKEADVIGARLAKGAGYPASAFVQWLRNLRAYEKMTGISDTASYFNTHPLTSERIAILEKTVPRPFLSSPPRPAPKRKVVRPWWKVDSRSRRRVEVGFEYRLN